MQYQYYLTQVSYKLVLPLYLPFSVNLNSFFSHPSVICPKFDSILPNPSFTKLGTSTCDFSLPYLLHTITIQIFSYVNLRGSRRVLYILFFFSFTQSRYYLQRNKLVNTSINAIISLSLTISFFFCFPFLFISSHLHIYFFFVLF